MWHKWSFYTQIVKFSNSFKDVILSAHAHLFLMASSFSGSSTTTEMPSFNLDLFKAKSRQAIFALFACLGMATKQTVRTQSQLVIEETIRKSEWWCYQLYNSRCEGVSYYCILVCAVSEIGAHVLSHCKSAAELALCISSLAHTHSHKMIDLHTLRACYLHYCT